MELWAPRSVEAALLPPPPDGSGRHRFSADSAGLFIAGMKEAAN